MGISTAPFSYHVPGENADGGARPDGRLCTPADHGARAKAAVVYVGEVVFEGSAEEVRESGLDIFIETVGRSEKRTCFRREGEWVAPGGGHLLPPGAQLLHVFGDESCG